MTEQRTPDSPPYQFDAQAFHEELDKALTVAADVKGPTKVPGVERTQGGVPILVARCPVCQRIFALGGEGRHLCRTCLAMNLHTWLQVEKAG